MVKQEIIEFGISRSYFKVDKFDMHKVYVVYILY